MADIATDEFEIAQTVELHREDGIFEFEEHTEICDWIQDPVNNLPGVYDFDYDGRDLSTLVFFFSDEKAALAFKMRWS